MRNISFILYLFIFRMPQPNGEDQMPQMQEVPRPVVPEPVSGNDAPGPQAGHQARPLTAEEKLEVNV